MDPLEDYDPDVKVRRETTTTPTIRYLVGNSSFLRLVCLVSDRGGVGADGGIGVQ